MIQSYVPVCHGNRASRSLGAPRGRARAGPGPPPVTLVDDELRVLHAATLRLGQRRHRVERPAPVRPVRRQLRGFMGTAERSAETSAAPPSRTLPSACSPPIRQPPAALRGPRAGAVAAQQQIGQGADAVSRFAGRPARLLGTRSGPASPYRSSALLGPASCPVQRREAGARLGAEVDRNVEPGITASPAWPNPTAAGSASSLTCRCSRSFCLGRLSAIDQPQQLDQLRQVLLPRASAGHPVRTPAPCWGSLREGTAGGRGRHHLPGQLPLELLPQTFAPRPSLAGVPCSEVAEVHHLAADPDCHALLPACLVPGHPAELRGLPPVRVQPELPLPRQDGHRRFALRAEVADVNPSHADPERALPLPVLRIPGHAEAPRAERLAADQPARLPLRPHLRPPLSPGRTPRPPLRPPPGPPTTLILTLILTQNHKETPAQALGQTQTLGALAPRLWTPWTASAGRRPSRRGRPSPVRPRQRREDPPAARPPPRGAPVARAARPGPASRPAATRMPRTPCRNAMTMPVAIYRSSCIVHGVSQSHRAGTSRGISRHHHDCSM